MHCLAQCTRRVICVDETAKAHDLYKLLAALRWFMDFVPYNVPMQTECVPQPPQPSKSKLPQVPRDHRGADGVRQERSQTGQRVQFWVIGPNPEGMAPGKRRLTKDAGQLGLQRKKEARWNGGGLTALGTKPMEAVNLCKGSQLFVAHDLGAQSKLLTRFGPRVC